MSYFSRVRVSLAEGRVRGLTFDQAWNRMLRDVGRPPSIGSGDYIAPDTMAFAKAAFREGYYGRDVLGSASILAEADGWVGDHRVDGHVSANALVVA